MDGNELSVRRIMSVQSVNPVASVRQAQAVSQVSEAGSFSEILNKKINDNTSLSFSKHASRRLLLRDINFTQNQIERIENGVSKAAEKGIKDSLVMIDDVALVVNVRSKLVITAMQGAEENIFTNIDGAVIV